MIKILLTAPFLQDQVPLCFTQNHYETALNGIQNKSISGQYTHIQCRDSWQHKRITSVQNFSRLILHSLLFSHGAAAFQTFAKSPCLSFLTHKGKFDIKYETSFSAFMPKSTYLAKTVRHHNRKGILKVKLYYVHKYIYIHI